MNLRVLPFVLLASALAFASAGCDSAPGKPKDGVSEEAMRPDQVTDFNKLYRQNCAGCHGDHGKHGAAISLADPLYLAFAGEQNLQRITATGVAGTMMPGFAKTAGGMLTDRQITILTEGMSQAWGKTSGGGEPLPAYTSSLSGDTLRGQKAFGTYCASCHGAEATGSSAQGSLGSLVDPAYLSLITEQGLRSIVVAGKPDWDRRGQGMPDYRSYAGHALTDQEITDIIRWLASHRTVTPGQSYTPSQIERQHP